MSIPSLPRTTVQQALQNGTTDIASYRRWLREASNRQARRRIIDALATQLELDPDQRLATERLVWQYTASQASVWAVAVGVVPVYEHWLKLRTWQDILTISRLIGKIVIILAPITGLIWIAQASRDAIIHTLGLS